MADNITRDMIDDDLKSPDFPAALATARDDLEGLTGQWHLWRWGQQWALVRRLDDARYVAVVPYLFTWGLIVGQLSDRGLFHGDRWCYHSLAHAVSEATVWTGEGQPNGWHRHLSAR